MGSMNLAQHPECDNLWGKKYFDGKKPKSAEHLINLPQQAIGVVAAGSRETTNALRHQSRSKRAAIHARRVQFLHHFRRATCCTIARASL